VLEEGEARSPEFFAAEIEKGAPLFGFSFEPPTVERLARYLAELDRWRRRTNLTGPISAEELVSHVLESAFGQQLIVHSARVVDIGSGAGLPGIPLAVVRPDLLITLLEPRSRRAAFLSHAIRTVPVKNANVRKARAADLEAGSFDIATSRAVGGLPEVVGRADYLTDEGALLTWATLPDRLDHALSPVFGRESVQHVPNSGRKVITLYRKRVKQEITGKRGARR
jgi:16S rRNA (guanine527-N7)-methyltransferase